MIGVFHAISSRCTHELPDRLLSDNNSTPLILWRCSTRLMHIKPLNYTVTGFVTFVEGFITGEMQLESVTCRKYVPTCRTFKYKQTARASKSIPVFVT